MDQEDKDECLTAEGAFAGDVIYKNNTVGSSIISCQTPKQQVKVEPLLIKQGPVPFSSAMQNEA